MKFKNNELPDVIEITCPCCKGSLTVSVYCESILCSHCSRHVNVKEILSPSQKAKSTPVGKREVFCFKCGKGIYADKNAQAVSCIYCYNRNDLCDYKVKSILGRNLQTHGTLYLKKKGTIEISNILVGDAFIEGKINGDLTAMGAVEILKHGEVRGTITCRKLMVKKGGIFEGSVRMLQGEARP